MHRHHGGRLPLTKNPGNHSSPLPPGSKQGKHHAGGKGGTNQGGGGSKSRRIRCKKCEPCQRSDCGDCSFCLKMVKFGGSGKGRQTCIMRRCLQPMLPITAACASCRRVSWGQQPVIPTQNMNGKIPSPLMECSVCHEIMHPECVAKLCPGVEGIVNEDLPNSWKCPKCCKEGKNVEYRPRHFRPIQKSSDICRVAVSSPAKRPKLEPGDTHNDPRHHGGCLPLTKNLGNCSSPLPPGSKQVKYRVRSKGGTNEGGRGSKTKRTRCKKCEACQRSDCGDCSVCLIKFGGSGQTTRPCVMRQCLQPMLPITAACASCRRVSWGQQPVIPTQYMNGKIPSPLMECSVCYEIMHPECVAKLCPGVEGIVNEDLPNSWKCPKCCKEGKDVEYRPRRCKARQKSSEIRRMSVSRDRNSTLQDAIKVEEKKAEMNAVAAIHTAPGCDESAYPLTSWDNSASLNPAAADPVPAKRKRLEPDSTHNRPKHRGVCLPLTKNSGNHSSYLPRVSKQVKYRVRSKSGTNEGGRGSKTKRTRCKKCEACQRSDCGDCSVCLIKFGGSGQTTRPCVMRQCLQPMLPVTAACASCRRVSWGQQPVIPTQNMNMEIPSPLMECSICYEIMHPECVAKLCPGVEGIVNEDLPNSWKCPKCCKEGKDVEYRPRRFKARQKSSEIRRMSVSQDRNSTLRHAIKVEEKKAEMNAVAAIHTAPGCDESAYPLTSWDNSASLNPAAADPVPAKRKRLEPDSTHNRPKHRGVCLPLTKNSGNHSSYLPRVSKQVKYRVRSKSGTNEGGRGSKTKRTRCKKYEACQRSDCGDCSVCLIKFGGSGQTTRPCVMRQCLQPMLPVTAACSSCRRVSWGQQPVIPTQNMNGEIPSPLMECSICYEIMHPECVAKLCPGVEGIVNEDLPNSWKCPKCCKEGKNVVYRPRHHGGRLPLSNNSGNRSLPLPPSSKQVKYHVRSKSGTNQCGGGSKSRRTRCKKCEACQRSDCGNCSFCLKKVKFGGSGKGRQTCIMRRCLQPMLPVTAACASCRRVGWGRQPVVPNQNMKGEFPSPLMECNVCYEIMHPDCVAKLCPGVEGIVNEDLPNSWKCPKCCKEGKNVEFRPCQIRARQKSSDIRGMSVSCDRN